MTEPTDTVPNPPAEPGCDPRSLPEEQAIPAARTAVKINPVNHPGSLVVEPQRIALLTTKYWGATVGELTVSFLDGPSPATQRAILHHMNAWRKTAGSLRLTPPCGMAASPAGGRVLSYLGTDSCTSRRSARR